MVVQTGARAVSRRATLFIYLTVIPKVYKMCETELWWSKNGDLIIIAFSAVLTWITNYRIAVGAHEGGFYSDHVALLTVKEE
jgi:hypothetical protein